MAAFTSKMPPRLEGFPSGQREQTVNLPSTTSKVQILPPPPILSIKCGHGSMVEPQPSKLMMRVRFPLPAPVFYIAHVAQLVEHTLGKGEVSGSNPLMSSMFRFLCFVVYKKIDKVVAFS